MDSTTIWPYLSFVLGSLFAVFLRWVSQALALRRDKRKEYWIRVLNSYQDFYQQTIQLIDLVRSDVDIPTGVYWDSMSLARKAAFDASFYDQGHPERTEEMKTITTKLLRILEGRESEIRQVEKLERRVEQIREEFLEESSAYQKSGYARYSG